jgi:predicted DNA-binding transcriptional regulator AlpA
MSNTVDAQTGRLIADPPIEPLLGIDDLAAVLNCSRRLVERMRSAGRLPRPDLVIGGRTPRWRPQAIRTWIEGGGQ